MENINNDMDLLNPKAGDVYLVAYPKAGVTWLTEIVTAVYRQYAIEYPNKAEVFTSAVRAHAFCDICPMARRRRKKSGQEKKIIGYDANGNEAYETDEIGRRRIVSLHFPVEKMERMIPEAFTNNAVKLIYTARNPKDIVVSYYHFHCMNDALPTPSSWEEFLEDFLSGEVRWGSWANHVRGWWNKYCELEDSINTSNSKILWLTFEELKNDLSGGIRKVCNHLHLSLSDEGLDTVVQRCTFASMKADPVRNHSKNSLFKGDFLRKGTVGDWKHKFTDEQSTWFDKVLKLDLEGDYARLTSSFTQNILGA